MAQALPAQISCLLIPVQGTSLLLPNASVAEVIDYHQPDASLAAPQWFLGFIRWRGLRLPLISYEAANGDEAPPVAEGARITVTNTIGEHHPPLSFMAVATQGIPRLVKVTKEELTMATDASSGPLQATPVRLSGEEAIIPELVGLEKLAVEALAKF